VLYGKPLLQADSCWGWSTRAPAATLQLQVMPVHYHLFLAELRLETSSLEPLSTAASCCPSPTCLVLSAGTSTAIRAFYGTMQPATASVPAEPWLPCRGTWSFCLRSCRSRARPQRQMAMKSKLQRTTEKQPRAPARPRALLGTLVSVTAADGAREEASGNPDEEPSEAALEVEQPSSTVKVLTVDDISSGAFTIDDVVLPLPGKTVISRDIRRLRSTLSWRRGQDLLDQKQTQCEGVSVEHLPGLQAPHTAPEGL